VRSERDRRQDLAGEQILCDMQPLGPHEKRAACAAFDADAAKAGGEPEAVGIDRGEAAAGDEPHALGIARNEAKLVAETRGMKPSS
jgi:hypothetical protein